MPNPPKNYIPVNEQAIRLSGLADQPMLYWREDWGAPRVMRLSDWNQPPFWLEGAYVRECKALTEAQSQWVRRGNFGGWDLEPGDRSALMQLLDGHQRPELARNQQETRTRPFYDASYGPGLSWMGSYFR